MYFVHCLFYNLHSSWHDEKADLTVSGTVSWMMRTMMFGGCTASGNLQRRRSSQSCSPPHPPTRWAATRWCWLPAPWRPILLEIISNLVRVSWLWWVRQWTLLTLFSWQAKLRAFYHAWNPADCSRNIYVKPNGFTLHRNPVAQSTDGARGKIGFR